MTCLFRIALALVLLATFKPTTSEAGAQHTEFTGSIFIVNTGNGEFVSGTGAG